MIEKWWSLFTANYLKLEYNNSFISIDIRINIRINIRTRSSSFYSIFPNIRKIQITIEMTSQNCPLWDSHLLVVPSNLPNLCNNHWPSKLIIHLKSNTTMGWSMHLIRQCCCYIINQKLMIANWSARWRWFISERGMLFDNQINVLINSLFRMRLWFVSHNYFKIEIMKDLPSISIWDCLR